MHAAQPKAFFKGLFIVSPGTFAMKEQIERIKSIVPEMCISQLIENIFVLPEAMEEQHNLLTITCFGVVQAGLLILKEMP